MGPKNSTELPLPTLQLGPVTGMLLSGSLTSAFGWEVVFYVLGSALVVWFACFVFLVYSTPSEHPRISQVAYYWEQCF